MKLVEFEEWLGNVLRPPKRGSNQQFYAAGEWWRWKFGIPGTLEIRVSYEPEEWRPATNQERERLGKYLGTPNGIGKTR